MSQCCACSGEIEPFGAKGAYAYYRCLACATIQLHPMPSASELEAAYAEEYSTSGHQSLDDSMVDPAALNQDNARYHEALVRIATERPNARILEIACGYGGMWRVAMDYRLDWHGIDISTQSVAYCHAQGLPAKLGRVQDLPADDRYDLIVMCFVWEHFSDYSEVLRSCRDHLNEGGQIVTLHPVTPYAGTIGAMFRRDGELPTLGYAFTPPWHTCLMSPDGIRAIAETNGFRVQRIDAAPIGRYGGFVRQTAQIALRIVNAIGWRIVGEQWPLTPAHIVTIGVNETRAQNSRQVVNRDRVQA